MAEMCHVRSLNLPEEMPMAMPTTPATREGGAVSTSVMVVLKPRDDTTVGKNCVGASAFVPRGKQAGEDVPG